MTSTKKTLSTPHHNYPSRTGYLRCAWSGAVLIVLRGGTFRLASRSERAARTRTVPGQALSRIAWPHHRCDALVVERESSAAACLSACLPGRAGQVVLTISAVAAFDHEQIVAVLARERAHLQGRNHLVPVVAYALRAAFLGVAAVHEACSALGRLIEMLADDTAARSTDRLTVAAAWTRSTEHRMTPVAAVKARGSSTNALLAGFPVFLHCRRAIRCLSDAIAR